MSSSSSSPNSSTRRINKSDGSSSLTLSSISKYRKGQEVLYTSKRYSSNQKGADETTSSVATIIDIHLDDDLEPFYTISLQTSGKEKQTDDAHLSILSTASDDDDEKKCEEVFNQHPAVEEKSRLLPQSSNDEKRRTSVMKEILTETSSPFVDTEQDSSRVYEEQKEETTSFHGEPSLAIETREDTNNELPQNGVDNESKEEDLFFDEPPQNDSCVVNKKGAKHSTRYKTSKDLGIAKTNEDDVDENTEDRFFDEPHPADICLAANDDTIDTRRARANDNSNSLLQIPVDSAARREEIEEEEEEGSDLWYDEERNFNEPESLMNDKNVKKIPLLSGLPIKYFPAWATTTKSKFDGAEYYESEGSRRTTWKNILICLLLVVIMVLLFLVIRDDNHQGHKPLHSTSSPSSLSSSKPSPTSTPTGRGISEQPSVVPFLGPSPTSISNTIVPTVVTQPSLDQLPSFLSEQPSSQTSLRPSVNSTSADDSITPVQIGQALESTGNGDRFGSVVFLSDDGRTVAVGAPLSNDNGRNSGLVRVFQYHAANSDWVQKGKDILGASMNDNFGSSLSLSGDGSIIAIGSPKSNKKGFNAGGVSVYQYEGNKWDKKGQQLFGKEWFDNFGVSVSLSTDGSTLAVGARGSSGNGMNTGYVRVYTYSKNSNIWEKLGKTMDGEFWFDSSGWSVSLSGEGRQVAVGAPFNKFLDFGHARVYQFNTIEDDWFQLGIDIDGEYSFQRSGWSVSMSKESVVAIGDASEFQPGQVRVYQHSKVTNSWEQIGESIDSPEVCSEISVVLSSDGTVVAIGCSTNKYQFVSVYRYNSVTDIWENIVDNNFLSGSALSLSRDGKVVAIGSPHGFSGSNVGRIKVFQLV